MAASGSYASLYNVADLMDEAWELAGLDPAEQDARHIVSARRSLNLMLQEISNENTDQEHRIASGTLTSVADQDTYDLPAGTIDLIDMKYIDAAGSEFFMSRITRQEDWYLEVNDSSSGTPRMYWVDRSTQAGDPSTDTFKVHVHPKPDTSGETFDFWRTRRHQNVTSLTEDVDVSRFWHPAVAYGWALKIAEKRNLPRVSFLEGRFIGAYKRAQMESSPRAPVTIKYRGYGRSRRGRR